MNSILPIILCVSLAQAEPAPASSGDEKLLQAAGVPCDGPGLLKYIQQRTLNDLARVRVGAFIARLGHDDFLIREEAGKELIALGPAVLPALMKAAESSDPEVALRATNCLAALPKDIGVDAMAAVIHLLGQLRPEGSVSALVAFLPDAGYRSLDEDVLTVLLELTGKNGVDPALRQATLDKHPLRRRAAALCLARSQKADDRPFLKALIKDTDLRVRREAIFGLVRLGDKSVISDLLTLIDKEEPTVALQADELLRRIAGDKDVPAGLDHATAESCAQCRASWQKWWQAHGDKLDLAERLHGPVGLTVIGETSGDEGGQLWECGLDGKPRWRIAIHNPMSVQRLPNQHLLVADFAGEGSVTEYDAAGKIVWTRPALWPVSCQRLPSGNTFIATESSLLEVTRGGRVVFFLRFPKHIFCARKLANGHIVYLHSQGYIAELNAAGEEERMMRVGVKSWGSFEPLPNDHILLANYGFDRVVELDNEGRTVWEVKVDSPASATRLPNGHTLVASAEGRRVIEFDRAGRKVWEQTTKGKPHFASRR